MISPPPTPKSPAANPANAPIAKKIINSTAYLLIKEFDIEQNAFRRFPLDLPNGKRD